MGGEPWAKSEDPVVRGHAEVVSCMANEVVYHVAFLCGGWEHLRLVTKTHRAYDNDSNWKGK